MCTTKSKTNDIRKLRLVILFALSCLSEGFAQTDGSKNFYDISRAKNDYYNRVGKDKPGYKQFKRWEWYYSTRTGPGGVLVDNQQMNLDALRSSTANRSSINTRTDANTGGWSHVGPTSVNSDNKGIGRINRIAFHPTNVNTLYVASATGGLWITTDGGANWYSYSEGIPNMALSGVAVNYNNTSEIYVLTGDADDGKRSNGVLKTYDGGFTWYRTGLRWTLDNNAFAYKLLMHPTNPSLLMIPTNKGIFRTTNGGATWDSTETGFHFYDMEFQPGNPSIVYACGKTSDSIIVMKSSNAGQTFTRTHAIRRLRNFDNDVSSNRSAIAVTAANANYVYLMTGPCTNAGEFQGFYRSTDVGETFTLRTATPNILGGSATGNDARDQEGYDMAVVASPTNANRVACGGIRLWTSTTGGTSFAFQDDYVSSLSYYHVDIHDLVYHPLDNTKLYMCSDGGVYLSQNNGDDWISLNNNLQVTQYYKIATNPTVGFGSENVMIGGTQDNGTNKRSTGGTSSFTQILGKDGMDCIIDPDGTATYIATAQDGDIRFSGNSGSSFETIGTPESIGNAIGETLVANWVTPVAEVKGNTNQFIIGYDNAIVATRIGAGTYAFTNFGWSGRTFVKTARNNSNRIYLGDNRSLGQSRNAIRTTTDFGQNWSQVLLEFHNNTPVTDLAFNADNGNEIWITYGGYTAGQKVRYTSDGGVNWTWVNGSLPNVPINCIVFDDNNGNPAGAVYIGTDIGVFYRDHTLGDWVPFSNGLPVVEVTDLEIHNSLGLLRAGTYGRGIWETSIYSACPSSITLTTSNTAIFKPYYFQASTSVNSSAVHGSAGADVFYKAGTQVVLTPGFTATSSGENIFEAALGPCGGGVPSKTANAKLVRGVLVD